MTSPRKPDVMKLSAAAIARVPAWAWGICAVIISIGASIWMMRDTINRVYDNSEKVTNLESVVATQKAYIVRLERRVEMLEARTVASAGNSGGPIGIHAIYRTDAHRNPMFTQPQDYFKVGP